jgi:hypothetical protein
MRTAPTGRPGGDAAPAPPGLPSTPAPTSEVFVDDKGGGRPWPWALGVVIVPSAVQDLQRARELRFAVAVAAYKRGHFLVDVLTVNAEQAAVDLDDVSALARRVTAETVLVLDTCSGTPRLDLALPEGLAVCTVGTPPPVR